MASRAQEFGPTGADFGAGSPGLRPHGRLTEDSRSTRDTTYPQVSGMRGPVDSLSDHGGLTPGREGKGIRKGRGREARSPHLIIHRHFRTAREPETAR